MRALRARAGGLVGAHDVPVAVLGALQDGDDDVAAAVVARTTPAAAAARRG